MHSSQLDSSCLAPSSQAVGQLSFKNILMNVLAFTCIFSSWLFFKKRKQFDFIEIVKLLQGLRRRVLRDSSQSASTANLQGWCLFLDQNLPCRRTSVFGLWYITSRSLVIYTMGYLQPSLDYPLPTLVLHSRVPKLASQPGAKMSYPLCGGKYH